tara:strand:- start:767 stop:940 length:174 start_codon:yes stop_codon:yes gene_type:complete
MALKYVVKTFSSDNKQSSIETFNVDDAGLSAMYESAKAKYNSGQFGSVEIGKENINE